MIGRSSSTAKNKRELSRAGIEKLERAHTRRHLTMLPDKLPAFLLRLTWLRPTRTAQVRYATCLRRMGAKH